MERLHGSAQGPLVVLPQLRVEPVGGGGLATSGPPGASVATYMCRALLPARRLGFGSGLGLALTLTLTQTLALILTVTRRGSYLRPSTRATCCCAASRLRA